MGSFMKEILGDIKRDIRSDLRTEARSATRDIIKGIKDAIKPSKDAKGNSNTTSQNPATGVQSQTVQPQTVQPQTGTFSEEEVLHDKVFGVEVGETKDIMERLVLKYNGDIAKIQEDPEYQNLSNEVKEYLLKVYYPAIKQGFELAQKNVEDLNQRTAADREATANRMQDIYNKYGEDEGQIKATEEYYGNMARNVEQFKEVTPDLMKQAGNIVGDIASKMENKEIKETVSKLSDTLKDDGAIDEAVGKFDDLKKGFENMSDMGAKIENMQQGVEQYTDIQKAGLELMKNDAETIKDATGMTDSDVTAAYNSGKGVDSSSAADELIKTASSDLKNINTEEGAIQATKDIFSGALKTFGSMFENDDK